MQQTVLLTAIRGPDGIPKYGPVKMLLRWYRRCILISSLEGCVIDTPYQPLVGGSFMGPSYDPDEVGTPFKRGTHKPDGWHPFMDDIVSQYLRELDALPHHFQMHLMHAFHIVGCKHPDRLYIGPWFMQTYCRIVNDMHLCIEPEEKMDRRLGDSRDQWLERNDPETVD
jgi:hypothetical protein